MELTNVADIKTRYGTKHAKYIYYDSRFDPRGIDYTRYIKIKYDSINNGLIKDYYTADGWYILFWLMSNGSNPYYITTTISIISQNTNIRVTKIKDILLHLQRIGIIHIEYKENEIKVSTPLDITILYNTDKQDNNEIQEENGYIPIPIEFIKNILPTLSTYEWSLYTVLVINYAYFTVWKEYDSRTNETQYRYLREHYAFPTYEYINKLTGISKATLSKCIKGLSDNKYKLIEKITSDKTYKTLSNGKNVIDKGGNNRYRIKLMERIEYVYNNIYKFMTDSKLKEYEEIHKRGFEQIATSHNQNIISGKYYLYIMEYYKQAMIDYESCIKNNSNKDYSSMRKNYLIEI